VQKQPTETKVDFKYREALHIAELHLEHDQKQADNLRSQLEKFNAIPRRHGAGNLKCIQLRNKLTTMQRRLLELKKSVDIAHAHYKDRKAKLSAKKQINDLSAQSVKLVQELSIPNNKAAQEKLNEIVVEKLHLETDQVKDENEKKKVPAIATYLKKGETEQEKWISTSLAC